MYVIAVVFVIREGHEAQFLARVKQQAEDSLAREDDCLQFDVCADPADPKRIFLYEIYRDEAAFQHHLETEHFKDFDAAVADWVADKTVEAWHRLS